MWCGNHLEPFREGWPGKAAIAMMNLFAASVADDRIRHASQGEVDRLGPVLREHGPMCCFLPAAVTAEVVRASLDGRKWEPSSADISGPEGVIS